MCSVYVDEELEPANAGGHMSIALDGHVAGPDQNLEHPLGRGGMNLHRWHLDEPLARSWRRYSKIERGMHDTHR